MRISLGVSLLSCSLMCVVATPTSFTETNTAVPGGAVLQDGTPVRLRISRTVSSADAHVGETVDFEVLDEIKVGNTLVVPKGGTAWGTVTEAESKKRMARGGKLNMNIDSVRLLDGDKVALRAIKEVKGGGHTGAMTGGIVATAIVFWPAAPFFLFMHGKDITVPKGTEITAYINGDFPLDLAKFQTPSQNLQVVNGSPQLSAVVSASSTSLDIASTPGNADIELDGNFAGDTPSTVGVPAGDHTIRITKTGYKPWEKKIRSSSGTVRVVAELESNTAVPATAPVAVPPAVNSLVSASPTPASALVPAVKRENEPAVATKPLAPIVAPPVAQIRPAVSSTASEVSSASAMSHSESAATQSNEDGTVSVTSTPDGADIFVDSVGKGHAPRLLKLKPGKHRIQLVASGYKDWVGEIDVKANSIVNVTGKLEQ